MAVAYLNRPTGLSLQEALGKEVEWPLLAGSSNALVQPDSPLHAASRYFEPPAYTRVDDLNFTESMWGFLLFNAF